MTSRPPIFVLGTTRSGTSALHVALKRSLKLEGYGEGHFFETIQKVRELFDRKFDSQAADIEGNLVNAITLPDVENDIYALYRAVYHHYVGESFIDKTPTYGAIKTAPLIHNVFPDAKIIYMQRRGIENVASKQRKFPNMAFENCCNEWSTCIRLWREVRPQLVSYIEIEQYRLYCDEESEYVKLIQYLGLNEDEGQALRSELSSKSIQRTGDGRAVSLETSGFTEEQITVFRHVCGEIMEEEGYSYTSDYFA